MEKRREKKKEVSDRAAAADLIIDVFFFFRFLSLPLPFFLAKTLSQFSYLVHGRVDLDVDVVAKAVGAQVHRQRDGSLAAEGARERVAGAGAETVAGRHGVLFLFFS